MTSATSSAGTTGYVYNAIGQLIEKTNSGGTTLMVYDEKGHLLGEYSGTGALVEETIWMDDLPVATLRPRAGGTIAIYYVHSDHLGTPRKITNPTGNAVLWRWDPDTFGTAAPSITTISYNRRFPGQYYQSESGLNYDYFRDYDPTMGRYMESDPIGLRGGINTYAYTRGNPISRRDPSGLIEGWTDPSGPPDFPLEPNPSAYQGGCPQPPPAPPGASVDANIDLTLEMAEGYSMFNPGTAIAYVNLVRTNGQWDYKNAAGYQYDPYGNFNFGATSAALGVPYYLVQNGAGFVQGDPSTGSGALFFQWPYGDDAPGALQIQAGYNYYLARSAGKCGCSQ
jgi:RHS repeat-associated protein